MDNFIFRKAEKKDVKQLAELAHGLNLHHDEDMTPDSQQFIKDWDHFEAYVIEKDNKLIAFLAGYNIYQFHSATLKFEIQNLFVNKDFRKYGVAKKLFDNVIALKEKNGTKGFSLTVWKDNETAIRFYEKSGFENKPYTSERYILKDKNLEKFIQQL